MSVMEKVKSYVGAYGDSDIRSLLHSDHERFRVLAEQMASDESKQKRTDAFDRLKTYLAAHARAEEQAVYKPLLALRGSPDSRALANEGFVEHSLVDVLLERLGKTELAGTEAWSGANTSRRTSVPSWVPTLSRERRSCFSRPAG